MTRFSRQHNLRRIESHFFLLGVVFLVSVDGFMPLQQTSFLERKVRNQDVRPFASARGQALYVSFPRFNQQQQQQQQLQQQPPNKKSGQQPSATKEDQQEKEEVRTASAEEPRPRFTPPAPHEEEGGGTVRGSKFRKLKDMIWIRETVEDLTAAEFACSVEAALDENSRRRRKRAVDYDKILAQLNKRLQDLGCGVGDNDNSMVVCELEPGLGMGTTVYSDGEREQLFEKIINTRIQLISVVRGNKLMLEKEEDSREMPFKINLPSIQIQKEENVTKAAGPKLYVRDDGTVDWDGALQDRAALKSFGTAVWARINGRDPQTVDADDAETSSGNHGGQEKAVTAKIEDTPQIVEARQVLTTSENALKSMELAHTKLLRTALCEGQAVANVNLASLEPALRSEIRESADLLDNKKQEVAFQILVYEMERIYTYLVGEVGNPANQGYVPLQDRLNVAELGLLESQLDSFTRELQSGGFIDADVLVVVGDQVTDLKRRLGIDFYVTGLTFDAEAIRRFLAELLTKTKNGLAFYGRGCQLFWNDLVFCGFLIGRAAQGYTLKPREVRNLRRALKDFFTFIPVIIILLIPLTPIGHVLVFGAIQRFFPDFFPSCFTEARQNLLQLYETAEYSEFKINETLQQKITRVALAAAYFIVTTSRSLVIRLTTGRDAGEDNFLSKNIVDDSTTMNGSSQPNGVVPTKSPEKK